MFLIIVPSMFKVALKNFQWPSSFYLMFWISIKQLRFINRHLRCRWCKRLKRYAAVYLTFLLSCILVVVFSSLNKEIYLHGLSGVKLYISIFQKKNVLRKMWFLNQESSFHTLKYFKLLNKREERWNYVGKTVVNFKTPWS